MDLSFGPAYEAFRNEVKQFLAKHGPGAPKSLKRKTAPALQWQQLMIEHGYTARTIPKEYGGFGGEPDLVKTMIVSEEFAKAQVPTGLAGQGIDMLVPTLLAMGNDEQKARFIKPTLHGEMVWCQGYSEPGAGSDLANVSTSAVLEGDEWVVNGQKIWTSTAQDADWIFCLVRTEPDAPKHQGISFLLFEMNSPGIEVRPLVDMTMTPNFNEVFFTDVRVPKHQIVGARGQGWQVANSILGNERNTLAPPDVALSRINSLIGLLRRETINGAKLIDNPVYRNRLMTLQGRVLALYYNDLRNLSAKLNDKQSDPLARLIVKLQGTELRHDLEGFGIDILGENGLAFADNPLIDTTTSWQYNYMYYLGLIIGGGTSQIQKNIIAERGLGLPREPKAIQSA